MSTFLLIMSTYFTFYKPRYIPVDIKYEVLAQGEFFEKSYFKVVLEDK